MDQETRDYIQSQSLLLPFQSTLDHLVKSTLAALPSPSVDVPDDEDHFLRDISGGTYAGVSGERWELSEGQLSMVKSMKKGLRRVEDQERVDAGAWKFPPRLSDEFLLPRTTCDNPPFLLPSQQPLGSQESFHAIISTLFDLMGPAVPHDDEEMEKLQRMPPADEALDLKLAATRAQMNCLKKFVGILARKKGTPVVDVAASLLAQDREDLAIEIPSVIVTPRPGSPPIFARPPPSQALDILPTADHIQGLLVDSLSGPVDQEFSSPTGKGVGMREWNRCEGIVDNDELASSGSVEARSPIEIWSSPPLQSTPATAENFAIETPVFPRVRIKLEEEEVDLTTDLIQMHACSAPDEEEIDELADDDTIPGLCGDLAVVLEPSDSRPSFLYDTLDTEGLATSLIVDARLHIPFLPTPPTTQLLPDSIHDFAPDSSTIWAFKRTTGIPSLTIELGWQAWVMREGESVWSLCDDGGEGVVDIVEAVQRVEVSMKRDWDDEDSLVDRDSPLYLRSSEGHVTPLLARCPQIDIDNTIERYPSPPPSTVQSTLLDTLGPSDSMNPQEPQVMDSDDEYDVATVEPATQYPMMYEDDFEDVDSPARCDGISAGTPDGMEYSAFVYPESSTLSSQQSARSTRSKEEVEDDETNFDPPLAIGPTPEDMAFHLDLERLFIDAPSTTKPGGHAIDTIEPQSILPTSSWTSSDALWRFLHTRGQRIDHHRPPKIEPARLPPSKAKAISPPTTLLNLPISTPAFLDVEPSYKHSDATYRVIATSALLQMRSHFESLQQHRIDLVDRPPRYAPRACTIQEPHLIVDGKTAVLFHRLIRIVGNAVRPDDVDDDGQDLTRDEALWTTLHRLSYAFDHLIVILEEKDSVTRSTRPFGYTPPVLNALAQLVAAAHDHRKDGSTCQIDFAIATNPMDSARLVRRLLDHLRQLSATGDDDRAWLTDDPTDDEEQLLQASQLNAFSACSILSSCSVAEFVSISREDRLRAFGDVCGVDRINGISDLLAANQDKVVVLPSTPSDCAFVDINAQLQEVQDSVGEVFNWECYDGARNRWEGYN